jgi:nitronate monooxygenase
LSERRWLDHLQLRYPIIQAPLAGGGDTPELVAAVSNAGGLGFFGAGYSDPNQVAQVGAAIRARTNRPFGVNLFAPIPVSSAGPSASAAMKRLERYYAELNLGSPSQPQSASYSFDDQLGAALQIGARAFSFTFGLLPDAAIRRIKAAGLAVFGTATTVDEAVALKNSGVDAIVAQGVEAGGHRGSFAGDFGASMIGTISLVPQIVDAVGIPVIASGGIMDGRGVAAALALGAAAVQLGTAFLTCLESGIPECYKAAILGARESDITTIASFSGRPARGIANRFSREMQDAVGSGAVLPFPYQNSLTRPIRSAAAKKGDADFLSLWAGQGVRMARRQTAAELITRIVSETELVLTKLTALAPGVEQKERG